MFIDAANILYSQQTLGWDIDYKKLIQYFKKNTKLVTANFYSGRNSTNDKQTSFFKKMESFGYKVTTKEVKWIRDRNTKILRGKGNLDIELALDVVQSMKTYDTLVLLSGDSDFEPVVNLAKSNKKKVLVLSTRGHISKELARSADKYIPLEVLKVQIKRGN